MGDNSVKVSLLRGREARVHRRDDGVLGIALRQGKVYYKNVNPRSSNNVGN